MTHPNTFAAALAGHELSRLRAAFEACKTATGERYDRTTLNRWLSGSVPTKEAFVQSLATELGDQAIYTAWQEAREAQTPSIARSVVTRFAGLSDKDKDWAFHQIRGDYLRSTFPRVRSRPTYRVEIHDPPNPDDDHLEVRLSMTWVGAISAGATVQFVSDQEELGDAYGDQACIFREILDFPPDRLDQLLTDGEDQVLAVNPIDTSAPRGAHHIGQLINPGVFQFDNTDTGQAQVRISLSYPYPRGTGVFYIKWGGYVVPDTSEVTLALYSRSTSQPRAFPFMPPGRQREWAQSMIRANELFISLGTGNTVMGEGDGVVLDWTES